MKNLFLTLFLGSFIFASHAASDCQRSLVLEGKSPHHKLISSLAFYQFTSQRFYEYLIPSKDEAADFTLVMGEVGIRPGVGQLELTCQLELLTQEQGTLGMEEAKLVLAQNTSSKAQARYLRKSCLTVIKRLFNRIPICPYWIPHF